jgi:serine phosphatase RsbU (regulator of sigma subunit)
VRNHFGEAYAVNFTQLKRQSILAPLSRELALSRRLAGSVLTRQWLLDESDPAKKALFFEEAEGYRKDLRDHAYFVVSALSRSYYASDSDQSFSDQPRYELSPESATDSWFFSSLTQTDDYNINVNYDDYLQVTRVWINVAIRDGERKIGMAGAGIDLTGFLAEFMATAAAGVTPIVINQAGAIQAHRNRALIAINQAGSSSRVDQTLAGQLPEGEQRDRLAQAMQRAVERPGEVSTLRVTLDGKAQLLALSYIPELKWHIVSAVDLQAAQVLDQNWRNAAMATLVAVVAILLLAFGYAVEKLVLRSLRKLQQSASAMAQGDFDVSLPPPGGDELGDLSRAFAVMASQIRSHTAELESRIKARTQALEVANQAMQLAHKQINDSLDYASLIQRAILPDQQLRQVLGERFFVIWHPRDVVGGDFYVFRVECERYLFGIVDCAGHGVPGALMTMLARSALDHAMSQVGIDRPASLLAHTDRAMRDMLQHCEQPRALATNLDAGLVYIDPEQRRLRYAGAKISLYWSDGDEVGEIKGGRRALGDRHQGDYADSEISLRAGVTYYLATDGFLDQAGGEMGYGFGNTRFAQLLLDHARLPMAEQASALDLALRDYQGDYAQRDDITLLSFRFD